MLRPANPLIQWRVWYVDMSVSPPRVHTFDNTMGTPADCQLYGDEFVLTVRQRSQLGQTTDRVPAAGRYAYLDLHQMWTGASIGELALWDRTGIAYSANLNGGILPTEIYTNAMEWPDVDDDFPSMAPAGAFGIADEDRYNAAILRERSIRLGRPESQAGSG